ncbi:MAG: shikimate dehydrogenase [Beijerinckiaceae bacterium]
MTTKKAAIIGSPVAHSRSPLIHGHWLKQHGIDGDYARIDVPADGFNDFIRDFHAQGFTGGNVTLPHKVNAYNACDRLTDGAKAIGAVNTIWFEDGLLCGDNTDGVGYVADLDDAFPGWSDATRNMIVLGAGGAARGILFALHARGLKNITLVNRTRARAEAVASPYPSVTVTDWQGMALSEADLIINTTSLGMKGQPPLDISLDALKPSCIVSDIIYVPTETDFLRAARQRGLRTRNGLGMLLHQAVPGFARWFGVTPRVTPELRAMIEADIGA